MSERNDMPALPWHSGILNCHGSVTEGYTADQVRAYAQQYAEQRVREEREACAKVCDKEASDYGQSTHAMIAGICAAAIRKRGEQ